MAFGIPLSKLWKRLSPNELALYRAKYSRYPFGSAATDLHFARLTAAVVKDGRTRDYMLNPPPEQELSWEQGIQRTMAQINAQVKR